MATRPCSPYNPLRIVSSIDEENSIADDENPLMEESREDELLPDCPICLDPMSEADLRHPLQCTNHCGYNFCRSCIKSLISSSQDDYVEASDGSRQVKIFLHCPNCRSDLSESIRDTVLLRRAAQVEKRQRDLHDSAKVMKDVLLHDALVKDVIEEAKKREAEFFRYQTSSSTESDSSDQDGGDWGVEADLINGVHQSFHCPREISFRDDVERILRIDETLLGGLADLMTEHQQEKITDLLTSGDPQKLVEGAELLRCIAQEINPNAPSSNNEGASRMRSSIMRGSIYGLIRETQKAHLKVKKKARASNSSAARARFLHRQMEMELRERAEYANTHPLPVRMPKSVELTLDQNEGESLTFVDDLWDGTIDCFNKLTIGFDGRVHKYSQPNHKGVQNVLDSNVPIRIALETGRVVVSSVKGNCGRQGVLKGDVVTHVNGKPWTESAEALRKYIASTGHSTIRLSLNCGPAVAEALKRRSLVL